MTKRVSGPAGVYRLKSVFGKDGTVKAEKVADVSVPAIPNGFLTGGCISPDVKRFLICDYSGAYEFTLPMDSKNFDDIWLQTPEIIDVGKRKTGEAVTYSPDGNSIILTSEGRNRPHHRSATQKKLAVFPDAQAYLDHVVLADGSVLRQGHGFSDDLGIWQRPVERCTLVDAAFFAGCLEQFDAACLDPDRWVVRARARSLAA